MQVSTNFAPPFKLIAPFFIIGVFIFLASCISLFALEPQGLTSQHSEVFAWVHLFLLGFVMMVIFGAMAQLVPVVLEVEHFAVELYYVIYPLLFMGTLLMVFGFLYTPILLPFGGVIAFIAFAIFLLETFMTLIKVKKYNFTTFTVLIANIFLLIGLIIGILMSLGYSGIIQVDLQSLLISHIYFVFIGYVGVSIIGMTLVLLPMFWLSHSFSMLWVKAALGILIIGILSTAIGSLIYSGLMKQIGYLITCLAAFVYLAQIFIIYKTKARIEKDIYLKSILIGFTFFIISILLGMIYLYLPRDNILLALGWYLFGFILFLISGHFYKIIPFLVWYERFSPYVGKRKIPMLSDMVPNKSANMQILFCTIGWLFVGVALFLENTALLYSASSFLTIGAIFLIKDIIYMIGFKENV